MKNHKLFSPATTTNSTTIPLTKRAFSQFKQKFSKLKNERAEVMARLKTAREMGDLSENGAYKYAKFELSSIGRQMRELQHILDHAVVTTKQINGQVGFGSVVGLERNGVKTTYQMASGYESDLSQHKLSINSPMGLALTDKKVGDVVIVNAPAGQLEYKIVSID